jgi:hypothetical protein
MHVDGYLVGMADRPPFRFFRRWAVEPWPEPYWNGYVYYTLPHEDGECHEHAPVAKLEP